MDIVHVKIVFEQVQAKTLHTRIVTRDHSTFQRMKENVGAKVLDFNRPIPAEFIVRAVRQAEISDYELVNGKPNPLYKSN